MQYTQNRKEDNYNPAMALSFKWFGEKRKLTSVTFTFGVTLRKFDREQYFTTDATNPLDLRIANSINDDLGIGAKEEQVSYKAGIISQTQWLTMKNWLQRLTKLGLRFPPVYTAEVTAEINRLDFNRPNTLNATEIDQYKLNQKLDVNLHANVTGGAELLLVWDVLRNINSHTKRQEVFGYQIGLFARILF